MLASQDYTIRGSESESHSWAGVPGKNSAHKRTCQQALAAQPGIGSGVHVCPLSRCQQRLVARQKPCVRHLDPRAALVWESCEQYQKAKHPKPRFVGDLEHT